MSNGTSAVLVAALVAAVVVVLVSGSSPPARAKVVDVAVRRTNSMPAPPGFTRRIFEDSFKGTKLNKRKWNTYITSKAANGLAWNPGGAGGSGPNAGGFNAAYFQPREDVVDNGLTLLATRASTHAGFPWTSGVVSTYGKFQFDGGYVQVKAKVPPGDGMWPAVWMLPGPGGTGGDNFELDVFEGNYIANGANPNDNDAWNLHTPSATFGGVTNAGTNLSSAYHIYGMNWVPGQSITWYLDGRPIGALTSAETPIPNEPMELILDLQVANGTASSWRTAEDASTPSPSAMEVAEVQVYRSRADRHAAR
jgi:beta-glucanase (GH16 family)